MGTRTEKRLFAQEDAQRAGPRKALRSWEAMVCGIGQTGEIAIPPYKRYVATSLCKAGQPLWAEGVSRHRAQVPYTCFKAHRANLIVGIREMGLAWSYALCIRSWSRLRAG